MGRLVDWWLELVGGGWAGGSRACDLVWVRVWGHVCWRCLRLLASHYSACLCSAAGAQLHTTPRSLHGRHARPCKQDAACAHPHRWLWDAVAVDGSGATLSLSDRPSISGAYEVLASFSSFGPTADGRIKPDLVAPGAMTLLVLIQRLNVSFNRMHGMELGARVLAPLSQ